jgi:hypothetical protein
MKGRVLSALTAMIFIVALLTGCEDRRRTNEVSTSVDTTGKMVVRAALVDALWQEVLGELGEEIEVPPDAQCVAESSFYIDTNVGFMIMKNKEPTEYNSAPVIIVSSINILIPDSDTDMRGANCEEEESRYIVTASEEAPIDMMVALELAGRHNIEILAKDEPTPYPPHCLVTAHFERHGGSEVKCGEAYEIEPEEPYEVEPADQPEDESADQEKETDGDEDIFDDISCDDPRPFTLKFVVDDYNCRLYEM